jgi:hypothetical protein
VVNEKHSPGPWRPGFTFAKVFDANNHVVAEIDARGRGIGQVDADVRLIAAAPDMLDRLRFYAGLFQGACECSPKTTMLPQMKCGHCMTRDLLSGIDRKATS